MLEAPVLFVHITTYRELSECPFMACKLVQIYNLKYELLRLSPK